MNIVMGMRFPSALVSTLNVCFDTFPAGSFTFNFCVHSHFYCIEMYVVIK